MTALLEEAGVEVKFAIHPVAGRMPGHMNVLLAEAGVPYDKIFDLEEINGEFAQADVALIIGANDVVNPTARTDKSSPIYGMPILNADQAQNVIVIKRGKGTGYSGVENALFYTDNCRMLYGNAQPMAGEIIQHLKAMGLARCHGQPAFLGNNQGTGRRNRRPHDSHQTGRRIPKGAGGHQPLNRRSNVKYRYAGRQPHRSRRQFPRQGRSGARIFTGRQGSG
jgi:hypothetical protein